MAQIFNHIRRPHVGRSLFNRSHDFKFTMDMGQLIPMLVEDCIPGDVYRISNDIVCRLSPMLAPILHEISVTTHYYFVPYRILWDEWEDFITGGEDGDNESEIPVWKPPAEGYPVGSLWDYMGFPVDVDPVGAYPVDFPRRAYNFIYNEYYRDENIIDKVELDNDQILYRAWQKDYFTSALPWQQRGQAPALPITGSTFADFADAISLSAGLAQSPVYGTSVSANNQIKYKKTTDSTGNGQGKVTKQVEETGANLNVNVPIFTNTQHAHTISAEQLSNNIVDLSNATTFNVADLRLAFQIQKWLERNARGGARYTEFLYAHFGHTVRDDRLQRPEYIGGTKTPVITSEVLQTSSTDNTTPQGNMAGHGIAVDRSRVSNYRVKEFGCIVGIISIRPTPAYQQGIDRQWLRRTRYDFAFPEFVDLSEQAIFNAELVATNNAEHNNTIFGYQGRYDEYRIARSRVAGEFRDMLDYWHLGRKFDPLFPPQLNSDFIECRPDKRIFAVQDEPAFYINLGHRITAIRPLPYIAEPGFIDHH